MVNKVILIGNVGQEPEKKVFEGGNEVMRVTLATSERWKDKETGERKERTTWHSLQFRGGLVKVVEQYIKRGDKIYIEGKLNNYSTGEGDAKKWFTQINCNELTMLGGKPTGNGHDPRAGAEESDGTGQPTGDDDLPF